MTSLSSRNQTLAIAVKKHEYQTFLVLPNFTGFFYFVCYFALLPGIAVKTYHQDLDVSSPNISSYVDIS